MKLTQKIIDDLEIALDMRKKNGEEIWEDGSRTVQDLLHAEGCPRGRLQETHRPLHL